MTVVYKNVKRDRGAMQEMLDVGGGRRSVPVIVEAGKVTVGFGGS